jgi:hypothetical protein
MGEEMLKRKIEPGEKGPEHPWWHWFYTSNYATRRVTESIRGVAFRIVATDLWVCSKCGIRWNGEVRTWEAE